ncbi:Peptidase C19, ubiquitin carboxyl-terminal hydrolase 2 [Artemisia annua]|uniref:Peptidase C19, ubiquitin carboxyl-terminal hydrolase 2 n=1 Tax=Artemisia annua TaxID=35608 RepID=A0A2U1MHA0_ARTAN|nr:Peptidase C19, ubiquitin carboxyl-terminal hydrolase 2 [Artemisia annua]
MMVYRTCTMDILCRSHTMVQKKEYENRKRLMMWVTEFHAIWQIKLRKSHLMAVDRWWNKWNDYVDINKTVSTNEGSSSEHQDSVSASSPKRPSSIDNSVLINEAASNSTIGIELHDTLQEHTDYILVPEETWSQFCAWYGGGPKLARKVISSGEAQTDLSVEVYPLRLRLHLMPKDDQCAIRISKKVRIWDYFSHRKHALMNDLDKTLDHANIQMDQDILVEVTDNGCASSVQENGSATNESSALAEPSKTNYSIAGGFSASKDVPKNCNTELSQPQSVSSAIRESEDKAPASVGVRIWDYFSHRKHALMNDLDKTLDHANIQMDQDILVEVTDNGCTSSVQENGSATNESSALAEPSKTNYSIAGGFSASKGVPKNCNTELSQPQSVSSAIRESEDKAPTSVGVSTRGSSCGLTGLLNFGNTCFMNSAIQCLVHTPEFARYFREDYHQEINWHNPLGLVGELALAFGELLRKLWAPGRSPFAPRIFKAKLARFAPQFNGYNQHDSQELLAFLLDGLHEDLNRVKHKPYIKSRDADGRPDEEVADEYWANHIARNDSIIVDVCLGQYKSTLVCPACEKVSVTFDPFMHLSLPLQSTTTRRMSVTVFSCDGSAVPVTCTVTVPKQGRVRDLIQAVSSACAIKQNEKVFIVEIRNHLIHRLLEDPLMSLSSIKDDEHLSAYKIPKSMKNTKFLQLVHRREELETGNARGTTGWKPYGTPLLYPVSSDATITRGDLQLIVHTMLSPMLKTEPEDSEISNGDTSSVASDLKNTSIKADLTFKEDNDSKETPLKLPLKLVDGNNACIDLTVGEERTVRLPSSSISVLLYIDWSPKLLKKYETHYLENLPEVFQYGPTKKSRTEPLSLYSCLEAFLREEPLVPEDMWYCPQCQERRQASKKLDLWRLPEVLVIHLKRFSYSRNVKHKLETFVNFPIHDLDMTNYVANKSNPNRQVYELYALTNHYGSMGSGHYTAHIKLIDENRWYNFDDSHISPINEDDVKSSAAYVLFYRRVRTEDAAACNGPQSSAGRNSSLHK